MTHLRKSTGRVRHWTPRWYVRAIGGLVDLVGALGITGVLVGLGVIPIGVWWASHPELFWLEATALRIYRTPWLAYGHLWAVLAPLVVWHGAWGSATGTTPGLWLTGLRVVDATGREMDVSRWLLRAVAYLTWPATILAVPLLVPASRSCRGLHDVLSGSWVVAPPPKIRKHRADAET